MPYKNTECLFGDTEYSNLQDLFSNMYLNLGRKDKVNIKIPLKNGKIQMDQHFTLKRAGKREIEFSKNVVNFDVNVTEEQIDLLFKNVPRYLEKLKKESQFSLYGEFKREDRKPLIFGQNISYKELGKFQVAPEFPPELTREIKDLKVDGVEGYDYLNDENYGLAMKIGREFQKRGFERKGGKFECQLVTCVKSKEVGPKKLTKILRESSDNMEFYAESRYSSTKRLEQYFNMKINPNSLKISGISEAIYGDWLSCFLGRIFNDMKVEVDPNETIQYREYYKAEHPHLNVFLKKVSSGLESVGGGVKKGLSYLGYTATPFIYLYDKAVVEPREEMRDAANWALVETKTLKSNGMACIRMVDKVCMLKKYREAKGKEKIKAELRK